MGYTYITYSKGLFACQSNFVCGFIYVLMTLKTLMIMMMMMIMLNYDDGDDDNK